MKNQTQEMVYHDGDGLSSLKLVCRSSSFSARSNMTLTSLSGAPQYCGCYEAVEPGLEAGQQRDVPSQHVEIKAAMHQSHTLQLTLAQLSNTLPCHSVSQLSWLA